MVCQAGPVEEGFFNCGRCEKCRRTLLELSAVDRVEGAVSFRSRDVSPAGIFRGRIRREGIYHWDDLVKAFEARRRFGMSGAIRLKIFVSKVAPHRRGGDPQGRSSLSAGKRRG